MNNPLVTILLPTYNREKELPKALRSCMNQTYQNIEIMVVDDHSTDHTNELMQEYIASDNRIKYYYTPEGHKGANAARNEGIRKSKGDYFVFCDSDDELTLDSIEKRVNSMKGKASAMVYGNALCKAPHGINKWIYDDIEHFSKRERRKYILTELSLCCQLSVMVRRDVIFKVGLLDENQKAWSDDALIVSVVMRYPVVYCNHYLALVNKSEVSMTSNKNNIYSGCTNLLNKYKKSIIKETSMNRYILWRIRNLGNWFQAQEYNSHNSLVKKCYGILHKLVKKSVSPYFRRYFE